MYKTIGTDRGNWKSKQRSGGGAAASFFLSHLEIHRSMSVPPAHRSHEVAQSPHSNACMHICNLELDHENTPTRLFVCTNPIRMLMPCSESKSLLSLITRTASSTRRGHLPETFGSSRATTADSHRPFVSAPHPTAVPPAFPDSERGNSAPPLQPKCSRV